MDKKTSNNLSAAKKFLFFFIKFLLPGILLYFLISQTNVQNIVKILMSARPSLLMVAYACFILNLLIGSLRAKKLLNSRVAFSRFFHTQCLGAFWTNISPSKLGEISYPILWCKKVDISFKQGASTLILLRSIDYVLLLVSYLVGAFFIWERIDKTAQRHIAVFLFVTILVATFFIILVPFLTRYFKKMFVLFSEIKHQAKNLGLIVIMLSVLVIGLRYLALYFFLGALGVPITALNLVLMSFFLFLSKFVQTFASLGTYELAIVGALMVFGFDKSDAINLSFNVHLLQLIAVIVIGLVAYLLDLKQEKKKLA